MGLPITQERMQSALEYLWTTDDECAALRADTERLEFKAKRTKAAIFKLSEGTVAERTAIAETAGEVATAYEAYFDALHKSDAMRNRRSTETIAIEVWRSLNANRKQGQ